MGKETVESCSIGLFGVPTEKVDGNTVCMDRSEFMNQNYRGLIELSTEVQNARA